MGTTPLDSDVFGLLSAARSALELAEEALLLFEERRPEILDDQFAPLVIDGRRLERDTGGPLSRRGMIGAQAFLGNLVIVENCVRKISGLATVPPHIRTNALASVNTIKSVIGREVRNTIEHIDHRVVVRADQGLISSTIFDDNLMCSTKTDGTIGADAVDRSTRDTVAGALDAVVWTTEVIETLRRRLESRNESGSR